MTMHNENLKPEYYDKYKFMGWVFHGYVRSGWVSQSKSLKILKQVFLQTAYLSVSN